MEKVKCIECGREYVNSCYRWHVQKYHNNLSECEQSILAAKNNPRMGELEETVIRYVYEKIKPEKINQYLTKLVVPFNSFCNLMKEWRDLKESDVDIFFNYYLPYRKLHPNVNTSIELGIVMCGGNEEEGRKFYEKIIKPRNPYTGHGGELSPWSKEFVGYKDLNEKEKHKLIRKRGFCKENPNWDNLIRDHANTNINYYLNKRNDTRRS